MKKRVFLLSSLALLFLCEPSLNSIAEEEKTEAVTEETILKEKINSPDHSMNFYPRIIFGKNNTPFYGAETLGEGEFLFNTFGKFNYNYNYTNATGTYTQNTTKKSISLVSNFSYGIFTENLTFNLSYPVNYNFSNINLNSDFYGSFTLRLLQEPFTISLQPTFKYSYFGYEQDIRDGDNNVGINLLLNKFFDSFYTQGMIGYNYRLPYTLSKTSAKYPNELNYVATIGYFLPLNNFSSLIPKEFEKSFVLNITGYGNVALDSAPSNLLSGNLSLGFKNEENDFLLSVDKTFMVKNDFQNFSVGLGWSYKTDLGKLYNSALAQFPNFNAPKLGRALSMANIPKIDPEQIMALDLKGVEKGKKLFVESCTRCHALVSLDIFETPTWEKKVHNYRIKKVLSKSEESAIIDFIKEYKKIED